MFWGVSGTAFRINVVCALRVPGLFDLHQARDSEDHTARTSANSSVEQWLTRLFLHSTYARRWASVRPTLSRIEFWDATVRRWSWTQNALASVPALKNDNKTHARHAWNRY